MTVTLHDDQYMYLSHIVQFFLECGMFQSKVIEEFKEARFVFSDLFSRIMLFVRKCEKIL